MKVDDRPNLHRPQEIFTRPWESNMQAWCGKPLSYILLWSRSTNPWQQWTHLGYFEDHGLITSVLKSMAYKPDGPPDPNDQIFVCFIGIISLVL